ncbi:hypothetical protein RB653_002531 [Dictyostelium firmibasis]|uniref:Uncharacterized protein n=1 Tax=Dictyostelium firmibasis TaxID=79012 RepID=A0AAN7TXL4_9MYCE
MLYKLISSFSNKSNKISKQNSNSDELNRKQIDINIHDKSVSFKTYTFYYTRPNFFSY